MSVKLEDGSVLAYEEVVKGLDTDTIQYADSIGWGSSGNFRPGAYDDYLFFVCKAEAGKVHKAVQWLQCLLQGAIFDHNRFSFFFF